MNITHSPLRQIDHRSHITDATMQHRCIRRFQRHIRTATHGDANIGRSKRWRVIDTVANLGNNLTRIAKLANDPLLVFRQEFGTHFDAQILADSFCRATIIAGQHNGPNTGILQRLKPSDRIRARLVTHGYGTCNFAVCNQNRNRLTLIITGSNPRR